MNPSLVLLSISIAVFSTSAAYAAELDMKLASSLALQSTCEKHIEGFALKSKEPYKRMRQRHAEAVAAYESNPIFGDLSQQDAPLDRDALEQYQSLCEVSLDFMLHDGQPPDPQLATIEQTWNLFKSGLRADNKETIAACFNPHERPGYMRMLRQANATELTKMADSFTEFHLAEDYSGEIQTAAVKTREGRIAMIVFVKSARGWRISQL